MTLFVTERYHLPQSVKDDLYSRPVNWGFGMFSQAVYYRCVAVGTKVLTADLRWVNAEDLTEGDELLGTEEYVTNGYARTLQKSTVVDHAIRTDDCFLVETDRGSITVSTEHPFLARTPSSDNRYPYEWRKVEALREGDQIWFTASPWESESGDTWLAGMMDGEGSISFGSGVRLTTTQQINDYGVAERIIQEFERRNIPVNQHIETSQHSTPLMVAGVTSLHNVMQALGVVRPQRLLSKWGELLESDTTPSLPKGRYATVLSVTPVGEREIVHMETSTATFIAEGFVCHNTYSRTKEDGTQEHWPDTVIRVVEGVGSIRKSHYKLYGIPWDEEDWDNTLSRMAHYIFEMKFLPPGRGLWVMGTEDIYRKGGAALNNCGFTDITKLSDDAAWTMDMLMCGVGIGFNNNPRSTITLHKPNPPELDLSSIQSVQDRIKFYRDQVEKGQLTQESFDKLIESIVQEWGLQECVYVIPDTREGWFESVRRLIAAYEKPGQVAPHFVYDAIRPSGRPIRGFGGQSSGPDPLIKLHHRLRATLDSYVRGEINQTQLINDVFNQIGCCVVAGNVRRSAELAVGSIYDDTFINLKNYERFPSRAEWGWMSNNSVALWRSEDFDHLPEIADRVRDNGEPGILNMLNVRKYARYGKKKYDPAIGFNPCAEQPLQDKELCTLVEVFPTRCNDYLEMYHATRYATLYAQTVTLLPTHDVRTNLVMQQNRRIGVSMSGIADWLDSTSLSTVHTTLDSLYENCVTPWSEHYAEEAKVPVPIRLTTVKPSGTISNLVGVSPGMHHPTFRWGIRRMRVSEHSPIVEMLTKAGVPYEEDAYSDNTLVFEFPIEMGKGKTRPVNEVSIWEQASMVAFLQRVWSDNAVSNTLVFSPSKEGDQIERVIAAFAPLTKSLSLLPDQEEQQSYVQAPYERTSREVYRERSRAISEIDWSSFGGSDGIDTRFCDGDNCVVEF